jgi:DNA-binding NtrC family response regulator
MAETVLITTQDLEPAVRLRDAFQELGYEIELLTPGERIADTRNPVLLVITGDPAEKQSRRLAREAFEQDRLPILCLVDAADPAQQDTARRIGAGEIALKPIQPAEIAATGRRLIERRRLRAITGIIGDTEPMVEILERVVQIAPVSSTVLITGESGTGKERVARGIHVLSPRRNRPFIAANVAALPETLLESELFGYEKGAFTGAIGQRKGLFELADRSTLFLDEIGEMPQATQTKLLRVLEEREFMRLGGETAIHVDVRVIAATNQDLRGLVELGRFRRDLYYRINVIHMALPPLRERRADIPLLVQHFIRETSREHDRPQVRISPEAMDILVRYEWPGNVREIRNLVESMVVLSPGMMIRPEDIPQEIRDGSAARALLPVPLSRPVHDGSATTAPELEFIFRTLLQLRMDVEDLRREFEEYRRTHPEMALSAGYPQLGVALPPYAIGSGRAADPIDVEEADASEEDLAAEGDVVVYRPGMTLMDMERAAITAALKQVGGNRRRAAEILDMGERTLYRKIKEYDIPL